MCRYIGIDRSGVREAARKSKIHDIWQIGGWVPVPNQISFVIEIMTWGWVTTPDITIYET